MAGSMYGYIRCKTDASLLGAVKGTMSEGQTTLAKLNVGGDDNLYLLTTAIGEGGEEGFDLALSDGVKGWTGSCNLI